MTTDIDQSANVHRVRVSKRAVDAARAEVRAFEAAHLPVDPQVKRLAAARPAKPRHAVQR